MVGRDRDLKGEEQSFEFPTLVAHPEGGLSIFGRGSHNFYHQTLTENGFSERMPLEDGSWGARGRWVSAQRIADGILTARRAKKGIVIETLNPTWGKAPKLQPARIGVPGLRENGQKPVKKKTLTNRPWVNNPCWTATSPVLGTAARNRSHRDRRRSGLS